MRASLSTQYRGRTPPGFGDEWSIQTISHRSRNTEVTDIVGNTLDPWTRHLYVTVRRNSELGQDGLRYFVLGNETALRKWLDE